MYRNILVGLDGSPRQPLVLEHAVMLAKASGAKLHLCRAMTVPIDVPAMMWTVQGDDFASFLVDHGRKELAKLRASLDAELVDDVHVRVGQPADVLCKIAEEIRADLLVVGTHGYSGIDRLLGTTAAKVANRAPCSVLVIRAR
jgi:nucleotide-binding universal stress UspA family protein